MMPKRKISVFLLAAVVLCTALNAQAKPKSPYEKLDNQKLAAALKSMEMGELMNELVKTFDTTGPTKNGESPQGKEILVFDSLVLRARNSRNVEDKEKYYDQAEEVLVGLLAKVEEIAKEDEDQKVRLYDLKLKFIEFKGKTRIVDYTNAILYLTGGDADREMIVKHSKGANDTILKLEVEIQNQLEDWGMDLERLANDIPMLEEVKFKLDYIGAWVRYNYGMALNPEKATDEDKKKEMLGDKGQALNAALRTIDKFANEKGYGVQAWAKLLRGRIRRELKEFPLSIKDFTDVIEAKEPAAAVAEAMFDLSRVLAVQGGEFAKAGKVEEGNAEFTKAADGVEEFNAKSMELLGKKAALGIDFKSAMLSKYVYEKWADAVEKTDPEAAKKYSTKSMDRFMELLDKYPEQEGAILAKIVEMYRGASEEDYETINPGVLFAMAKKTMGEAVNAIKRAAKPTISEEEKKEEKEKAKKLFDETMAMFDIIVVRAETEEVAKNRLPNVLLMQGVIYNQLGQAPKAADVFRRVVVDHPEFPKAALASYNAVMVYNSLITTWMKEHPEDKGNIPLNLRTGMIACLEAMLKKWETGKPKEWEVALKASPEKNLAVWNYDLGFHSMKMSEYADSQEELKNQKQLTREEWEAQETGKWDMYNATSQPAGGKKQTKSQWFNNGWKAYEISRTSREEWIKKASAAYAKYPEGKDDYLDCQYYIIDLAYQPFEYMTDEQKKAKIDDIIRLISKIDKFTELVPVDVEKLQKKLDAGGLDEDMKEAIVARIKDVKEWGADLDFRAREFEYDILGKEDEALAKISKLSEKWPGTQSLQKSREFEIRKLVDKGKIADAIKKVRTFEDEYGKQGAKSLIALVVNNIRKIISKLSLDKSKAETLTVYVKAYLDFAEALYKQGISEGWNADKLYLFKKTYADALLLNGEYETAFKMFSDCKKFDDGKQEKVAREREKEIGKRLEKAKKLGSSSDDAIKAGEKYFEYREEIGLTQPNSDWRSIKSGLKYLKEGLDDSNIDSTELDKRMRTLVRVLVQGYKSLAKKYKYDEEKNRYPAETLPVDADVIRGLAESLMGLKKYEKSADYFAQLFRGLNPVQHKELFWDAQLKFCKCVLAANKDKTDDKAKKILRGLKLRCIGVRLDNKDNPVVKIYLPAFKKIELEADKLAGVRKKKTPTAATKPSADAPADTKETETKPADETISTEEEKKTIATTAPATE